MKTNWKAYQAVKARLYAELSQPRERQAHYQCLAKCSNGRLCRQPAIAYDPERRGFICERHQSDLLAKLRQEADRKQAA